MWAEKDLLKILVKQEDIRRRAVELGAEITRDYKAEGKNPLLVALLKGSVPWLTDISRNIDLDISVDYMDVSSYEGTHSTGDIRIVKDLDVSIKGVDILLVEDIVDTGKTIKEVLKNFYMRGASSVKIVTLLDKPSGRVNDVKADYIGFEIENEFVVGYGLDFNQHYRCLPFVGVLKPECYER